MTVDRALQDGGASAVAHVGFVATPPDRIRQEALAKQASVRWLTGALSVIALAIATGIGVVNVATLRHYQWLALIGALAAFAGAGLALWALWQATVRPTDVPLDELLADPDKAAELLDLAEKGHLRVAASPLTALRDFRGWQDRPRNALAAFQGKAEDLEAGREARIAGFQALLPALARAHECARIHPVETESDRRGKAELEGHVADLEGRIDQLQAYAELSEVEGRITRQRRPLIAGVLCAGVGLVVVMVAMALSANRYAAPAVAAPMPVVVQLGDDDASTLAETMAAKDENGPGPSTSSSEPAQGAEQRCSANSGELVEGLAVGGSWTQPVILLDEPGCPALTLETQDSTVEPAVSAPDNAKDSAISERVPVKAWLGPTHREELLRDRNGAAEICHAVAGQPVDADAVGGTWGQPYLIVRAIAETSSTFACGPVSLQRHDPETRVQPASTG